MNDLLLERGLPAHLESERAILGSLALSHQAHAEALTLLSPDDFSIEKHRRIFGAMLAIDRAGGQIDRITLASELIDRGQLESVDGLTYLATLDSDLPQFLGIGHYVEIVKEKAALRRIIIAAQGLVNRCLGSEETSAEIIAGAEQALSEIGQAATSDTAAMLTPGEVIEASGGLQKFLSPQRGIGVETPWKRLSDMTGGFRRGELFVVAGNPSHGKSALALQIGAHCASLGHGTQIISLEMSRESLVERLACSRARVDSAKLRAGYLSHEERARLQKAVNGILDWPLWLGEHGVSTTVGIRSALRKQRVKSDVFMVVIDYLQIMNSLSRSQNRNAEISEMTRTLKLLAVDERVNVVLLSQLNRDNVKEKRPPALHDLRESGSIEQDANAVLFVWRPEMLPGNRERADLRGHAELLLAKQREGPVGKIDLIWIPSYTKFESRVEDANEPQSEQMWD